MDAGDLPARVQAVVFGGRAARREDLADLADLRRRVRRRLRERDGRIGGRARALRHPAAGTPGAAAPRGRRPGVAGGALSRATA